MDFSFTIKIFVFITSFLILFVDESQGRKDSYLILRPREARRLSQILRSIDLQIAPKPWEKDEVYDQMSKKTEYGIETANLIPEISRNPMPGLTPIGTRPPILLDDEQYPMEFLQPPPKRFLSTNDDVPIHYFNRFA